MVGGICYFVLDGHDLSRSLDHSFNDIVVAQMFAFVNLAMSCVAKIIAVFGVPVVKQKTNRVGSRCYGLGFQRFAGAVVPNLVWHNSGDVLLQGKNLIQNQVSPPDLEHKLPFIGQTIQPDPLIPSYLQWAFKVVDLLVGISYLQGGIYNWDRLDAAVGVVQRAGVGLGLCQIPKAIGQKEPGFMFDNQMFIFPSKIAVRYCFVIACFF